MANYYEFVNSVKILSGKGAIDNLAYELKFLGCQNPLLLSDHTLEKIKTVDLVKKILAKNGIKIKETFVDIPVDSDVNVVNAIAGLYATSRCDGIVALGGGSVIDTAKGVRLVLCQNESDILSLAGAESLMPGEKIPFAVIPTTCGTGSECTNVAVIKDSQTDRKLEFISQIILPDVAIIDERTTETLPSRVIGSTGVDALSHAIEAYSCLQKNPVSDAYAIAAIKMISQNLCNAVKKNNKTFLANMTNAATLAGIAFSNSMVGLVHAIGHSLGAICKVSHGDSMAILLPSVMRFNLTHNLKDYSDILLYLTDAETYSKTPKNLRAHKAIEEVEKILKYLNKQAKLPNKLKEAGVINDDLLKVARSAINDGASLLNTKRANIDEIMTILRDAF